jgi:NAD(P)H-hydrate epimerase
LIDAAYGTGFRGHWSPPRASCPVLAVDVPSGLDGLTGCAHGEPWPAVATVTFASWKPGLLVADGPRLSGRVVVADIGLDVETAERRSVQVVEASDVASWIEPRSIDAHKWRSGVFVLAGGPGMVGAAGLASLGALRCGAGMVHLAIPGTTSERAVPTEVVRRPLPLLGWAGDVESMVAERFRAIVIGPGLGRETSTMREVVSVIANTALPAVIDGDGLWALGEGESATRALASRRAATVVTPHDGEFARLNGDLPSPDRIENVRSWAARARTVCLLKGPRTIVAAPDGRVGITTNADARLATAGTGDVLSGLVGALLARGIEPFRAALAGAWIHAEAAMHGSPHGLIAGDLPDLVPTALDALQGLRS